MTSNLKDRILEKDIEYFIKIFPTLKTARKNSKGYLICNTMRGERNPSLSIYQRNGRHYLHDFADPTYRGDVFELYALVNDIKDVKENFYTILLGLAEDLGIAIPQSHFQKKAFELDGEHDYIIEEKGIEDLTEVEKDWLKRYNISYETLLEYDMSFLKYFVRYSISRNEPIPFYSNTNNIYLAHKHTTCVKIYNPLSDGKYKFQFLGIKPSDYCIGISKKRPIEDIACEGKLVICSGFKDFLILTSLGYTAIALNSESTFHISQPIVDEIIQTEYECEIPFEVIVIYDSDPTGKECSQRLYEKYKNEFKTRIVSLPKKLTERGGKDVGDWIELGCDSKELIALINGTLIPEKKIAQDPNKPIAYLAALATSNNYSKKVYSYKSIIKTKPLTNES